MSNNVQMLTPKLVFINGGQVSAPTSTRPSDIEDFISNQGLAVLLLPGCGVTVRDGGSLVIMQKADMKYRQTADGKAPNRDWVVGCWVAIYDVDILGLKTRQVLFAEIGDRQSPVGSYSAASNQMPRPHDAPVRSLVEKAILEGFGEWEPNRQTDLGLIPEFVSKVSRAFPQALGDVSFDAGMKEVVNTNALNGTTKVLVNGKEVAAGPSANAQKRAQTMAQRRQQTGGWGIGAQAPVPAVSAQDLANLSRV